MLDKDGDISRNDKVKILIRLNPHIRVRSKVKRDIITQSPLVMDSPLKKKKKK